jgi:hypothetical protein
MRKQWLIVLALLVCPAVFAEQTVINNYGTSAPEQPANAPPPGAPGTNCQGNQQSNNNNSEPPIGTYSYSTPTTAGTIVTTGAKHPDLPGNNPCNNNIGQPIIQPYVYPGVAPTPGPVPTPPR